MTYKGTIKPQDAANTILDLMWEQSKPDAAIHADVATLLGNTSRWGYIFQAEMDDLFERIEALGEVPDLPALEVVG